MRDQISRKRLEMQVESRLKKLRNIGPMLQGSVYESKRKCGNPNCKCTKGEKHPTTLLSWKEKKVTKMIYVPVDMKEEVKSWVEEYKKNQRLIKEITKLQKQIIKLHVKTKRSKEKNRHQIQKT